MSGTGDIGARIRQATGLADLLDAAYQGFEEMLALIRLHDDPSDDLFVPMVLAGAFAASGRDCLGRAPSLPRAFCQPDLELRPASARAAAEQITVLCRVLADAFAGPVLALAPPGDQHACGEAGRCATEVSKLLSEPA